MCPTASLRDCVVRSAVTVANFGSALLQSISREVIAMVTVLVALAVCIVTTKGAISLFGWLAHTVFHRPNVTT